MNTPRNHRKTRKRKRTVLQRSTSDEANRNESEILSRPSYPNASLPYRNLPDELLLEICKYVVKVSDEPIDYTYRTGSKNKPPSPFARCCMSLAKASPRLHCVAREAFYKAFYNTHEPSIKVCRLKGVTGGRWRWICRYPPSNTWKWIQRLTVDLFPLQTSFGPDSYATLRAQLPLIEHFALQTRNFGDIQHVCLKIRLFTHCIYDFPTYFMLQFPEFDQKLARDLESLRAVLSPGSIKIKTKKLLIVLAQSRSGNGYYPINHDPQKKEKDALILQSTMAVRDIVLDAIGIHSGGQREVQELF